jgi:GNAT superfamily N-acetyltransferase
MVDIKRCRTDADFGSAVQITKDYIDWLDLDLSFQDIDHELSQFASMYGLPQGLFLLAWQEGQLAGGVGLRRLDGNICEMKRLFVYEAFRNRGIASRLCEVLIQEALKLGYKSMRLDTLGHMKAALKLYETLGFKEIGPYCFNPDPSVKYMELLLERPS